MLAFAQLAVGGCGRDDSGGTPSVSQARDTSKRVTGNVAKRHRRPPIGVPLGTIRESFRVRPYFFEFMRMPDVDGYPNFYGRSRVLPEAVIQTIGDTTNLSSIALIASVKPDTNWRLASFAAATRLAATIDASLSVWAGRGAGGLLRKRSIYLDTTVSGRHWSLVASQYADHARISLRVRSSADSAGRR